MTPTIHEINTVHKEKVIKLKCLIYKQFLECWLLRRGGFHLNLFWFSSLFSDFPLLGFINDMCMQNVWFNLLQVFSIDDITFAQRWFPHTGLAVSYTSTIMVWTGSNRPSCHSKKTHRLEVRLIYWEYLHLLLITRSTHN